MSGNVIEISLNNFSRACLACAILRCHSNQDPTKYRDNNAKGFEFSVNDYSEPARMIYGLLPRSSNGKPSDEAVYNLVLSIMDGFTDKNDHVMIQNQKRNKVDFKQELSQLASALEGSEGLLVFHRNQLMWSNMLQRGNETNRTQLHKISLPLSEMGIESGRESQVQAIESKIASIKNPDAVAKPRELQNEDRAAINRGAPIVVDKETAQRHRRKDQGERQNRKYRRLEDEDANASSPQHGKIGMGSLPGGSERPNVGGESFGPYARNKPGEKQSNRFARLEDDDDFSDDEDFEAPASSPRHRQIDMTALKDSDQGYENQWPDNSGQSRKRGFIRSVKQKVKNLVGRGGGSSPVGQGIEMESVVGELPGDDDPTVENPNTTALKASMLDEVGNRSHQVSTNLCMHVEGDPLVNDRADLPSEYDESEDDDFGFRGENHAAVQQGPSDLDTLILRHNIDYLVRAILMTEGLQDKLDEGSDFIVNRTEQGVSIIRPYMASDEFKKYAIRDIENYVQGKARGTIGDVYNEIWGELESDDIDLQRLAELSDEIHAKTESKAPYMAQRLIEEFDELDLGAFPEKIVAKMQSRETTIAPNSDNADFANQPTTAFAHLKHDYTPSGQEEKQAVEMIKMSNTGLGLKEVMELFNNQNPAKTFDLGDRNKNATLKAAIVTGHKGQEIGFYHEDGSGKPKPLSKDQAKAVGKAVMANVSGLVADRTAKNVMTAESQRGPVNEARNRIQPK